MYQIAVVLQVFAILFCLLCLLVLVEQRDSKYEKLMMVIISCSLLQNVGYLFELLAKDAGQALYAVKIEYFGSSFLIPLMVLFVFRYSKINYNRFLFWLMMSFGCLAMFGVWFCEYTTFYYTKFEFIADDVFPHVVLGKGTYYIIYSVIIYIEMILCAIVTFMKYAKTVEPRMKKNYFLLFLSSVVPMSGHIIGISGVLGPYDIAPFGVACGVSIFGVAIFSRHIFDITEYAHESILMNLDDAIVIVDEAYGFQECNNKAVELFPFLGQLELGAAIPDSKFNRLFQKNQPKEITIDHSNYDVHITPVMRNKTLAGYSVVLFDVTQKKQQYEKLRQLKEQADSANEAKSTFLANVSHEIRTPINGILGINEVILRDYDEPQLKEYSMTIHKSATTLLNLINDLLDFSKIEAGKMEIFPEEYEVEQFFQDLQDVYSVRANKNNLEFVMKVDSGMPNHLIGDASRLRQIAGNLLSNAIKYTSSGTVTLRAGFEKNSDKKGNFIISVEDTGIGIRKEDMKKLCEGFVRLDETRTKSIEGTGLGLNITKQLLNLMGGEMKVYSEYGYGSVFTVIIPQEIVDDEVVSSLGDQDRFLRIKTADFTCPDAKVLFVDDSKTNLLVAISLLKGTKVQITTAVSGHECIEIVQKERFDAIFLDHRMPMMDGVETLHEMEKIDHLCKNTPIIALTANAVNDARNYYLKEGFDDFIAKPITEESISKMLRKHLPMELVIDN